MSSRSDRTFKASELKRAVQTLEAVGKTVQAVEFRPGGVVRVLTVDPTSDADRPRKGGWDDLLDDAAA